MNMRIVNLPALACLLQLAATPASAVGAESHPAVEGVFGLDRVEQPGAIAFWTPLEPGQVLTGFSWFNNDGSVPFSQVKALAAECDRPELLSNATVVGGEVLGGDSAWSHYVFETPLASTEAGLYVILNLPVGGSCSHAGAGGGAGVGYTLGDGRRQCWFTVGDEPWEALGGEFQMAVVCEKSVDKAANALRVGRAVAGSPAELGQNQGELPPPAAEVSVRAYPNPFNPQVEIVMALAQDTDVTASVYDVSGRLVRALVSSRLAAGEHRWTWDGRDGDGRKSPSGVYLTRIAAGAEVQTIRLTLLQ